MRFITSALVALSTVVALALADNAIIFPTSGTVMKPKDSVTMTWTVTPGTGPISLELRKGPPTNMKDVREIGCEYPSNVPVFLNSLC